MGIRNFCYRSTSRRSTLVRHFEAQSEEGSESRPSGQGEKWPNAIAEYLALYRRI
jgi:hypothetical protein